MKTSASFLLLVLAATPLPAATRHTHSKAATTDGVPPKWGSLIQPATVTDLPGGLITSELSGKDVQFLSAAIENGRVQMWLCKTAKEKAETDQVRAVGDALEATQAQENTYLTRLAAKKGLTVASLTEAPNQKKLSAELNASAGPTFDKAVMEKIITAAQGAVSSYESAAQSGDGEIKNLAERLLPVAKDKLLLANKISGKPDPSGKPAFRTGAPAPIAQGPPATPAPAPGKAAVTAPSPLKQVTVPPVATAGAKPAVSSGGAPASPSLPVLSGPAPVAGSVVPPPKPAGPKPVPYGTFAPATPVPSTPASTKATK